MRSCIKGREWRRAGDGDVEANGGVRAGVVDEGGGGVLGVWVER